MKIIICAAIVILINLLSIPAFSDYGYNQTRLDREGNIYYTSYNEDEWLHITKVDSVNMKALRAFTVSDPSYCHINAVYIDPTGAKLVYYGACRYKIAGPEENSPQSFYFLKIVDRKTMKEISSFNHGQRIFSFSPSGDAIVYAEEIAGERGTLPPPGYQGGAWIYNFNTKAKKHLKIGVVDINWSAHDGNIYTTNGAEVVRYNVNTGKVEKVLYYGIYFTPDGKYNIYKFYYI